MDGPMFTNPVADGYFADPFLLHGPDAWYAYGTGVEGGSAGAEDGGRVFEARRSTDLVHWSSLGPVLATPDLPPPDDPADHREWWAPEVVALDGQWWLYYSTGIEDRAHALRVAVGDGPTGPFEDVGVELAPGERFAIDPDPFLDDDGERYLYFAHDVLEGDRPGTTIAVDRMTSPTSLAGEARTVLPASADWQRFRRGRPMYGGVYDWHTLEGPFVRRRLGRCWMLFSGGAWTDASYGVSAAVADEPLGPFTEVSPGTPALLRTVPGLVGPGHCSVVEGPDGRDWLAYHAWDEALAARRLCLDPIEWTPDGPRTPGPTAGPQPAPVAGAGGPGVPRR